LRALRIVRGSESCNCMMKKGEQLFGLNFIIINMYR